ncbi:hypothetical protein Purlil1_12700 [Purpureocillium lilacinum]|uniref:Uncharacterized protein n=1 Tax=Purpureocillium lilacinum TaxID=33203 RepID=A0ABR0BG62_PURLI|nr:hypothetical protein Purlil1_12700 [Purpureocillium lilacinum]
MRCKVITGSEADWGWSSTTRKPLAISEILAESSALDVHAHTPAHLYVPPWNPGFCDSTSSPPPATSPKQRRLESPGSSLGLDIVTSDPSRSPKLMLAKLGPSQGCALASPTRNDTTSYYYRSPGRKAAAPAPLQRHKLPTTPTHRSVPGKTQHRRRQADAQSYTIPFEQLGRTVMRLYQTRKLTRRL